MLTVKVGKVPGRLTEVLLEEGATVNDALEVAGIEETSGYEIRVGTEKATVDTELKDGDVVALVKNIKGAR